MQAERHALSAIESHSGDKRSVSPTLKASSGWGQKNDSKGEGASLLAVVQPQTHTCTFKPLPLNKKEKRESKEVLESQKVKAKDSEKLDSESKTQAESAPSLTCEREPKQSTESKIMDCHADKSARNDDKTESYPHANLESKADSEPTQAVGHSSTAIESHSGDKRSVSPTLKASSGASGISASDCKGEGATSQFKPLPLNKKEKKESKEVNQALEVKTADFKAIDSESENQAESARALDSEKQDLDSKNLESTTDSESKKLASRDTSAFSKPQYDND